MDANEILQGFSKRIGTEISLADNACSLAVDEMLVTILYLPEIDAITLSGDLGEPPPERLEGLYKTLLQVQYLFRGTGGATISLNPETDRFALCEALPLRALDTDAFCAKFETFANTLESFTRLIANFREAVDNVPAPDEIEEPTAEFGLGGFIRA